jgi:hypothetical protein
VTAEDRHFAEMMLRPAAGPIWLYMVSQHPGLWVSIREMIARYHYLGTMPDPRTSLEGYAVFLDDGRSDLPGDGTWAM